MTTLFELFYQSSGICTDTRKIEKDCLFVCLKGDHFNGNAFASKALEAGAKYVIADEEEFQIDERIYLVPNALKFLQDLANHHRNKFNIPIIGITGSNGKTSSKELINAVLSTKYKVLATIGNLNNHIGVPLTLLRLKDQHEIAIIEMGANHFKDIEELCEIANPTHGIITNIGKAHLEGFQNFEGVLNTKKELYDSILKNHGTIIYNEDDEVLKSILPQVRTISYGTTSDCNVGGKLMQLTPLVELQYHSGTYYSPTLHTKMIGKYNFYNFLAAITFGLVFDIPFEDINEAITTYEPDNNRSQVSKTASNTLILDCYNANPTSMRSALESFALIDNPEKIFIIGDMLELGKESTKEHRSIAELAEQLKIKGYTVGPIFKEINSPSFLNQFSNRDEMNVFLEKNPVKDHLILLKGSRGIGLEVLEKSL